MFSLIASNGSCVRFLDIDDYGLIKLILEDGIIKAYKGLSRDISGEFEYLKTITLASDIVSFEARSFDGTHFAIIYTTSSNINYIAIWPGDFPLYGNKDPYRLYYAVDSETLYMNVENRWIPVSYLSHDKMHDIGTMTHEQLENAIVGALQRISSLEDVQPEVSFTKEEW